MTSNIDSTGRQYVIVPDPKGIRAFWVAPDGTASRGPSGHKRPALRHKLTLEGATEIRTPDQEIIAVIRAIGRGERL